MLTLAEPRMIEPPPQQVVATSRARGTVAAVWPELKDYALAKKRDRRKKQ